MHELKRAWPDLPIAINGGLVDLAAALGQLDHVDGVMLGRAAYQNPELLMRVDAELFGEAAPFHDPFAVVEAYEPYIAAELAAGTRLHDLTRHMLGLFAGRPGARLYRQVLATRAPRAGAGLEVLREAVAQVGRVEAAA